MGADALLKGGERLWPITNGNEDFFQKSHLNHLPGSVGRSYDLKASENNSDRNSPNQCSLQINPI
jgi:hypothetical protein